MEDTGQSFSFLMLILAVTALTLGFGFIGERKEQSNQRLAVRKKRIRLILGIHCRGYLTVSLKPFTGVCTFVNQGRPCVILGFTPASKVLRAKTPITVPH